MNRFLVTLIAFLAGSPELWAQKKPILTPSGVLIPVKPECYRSYGGDSDYVLIIPIPGTGRSKTVYFNVIQVLEEYVEAVTEFPDGSTREEDYPLTNLRDAVSDYAERYCRAVFPFFRSAQPAAAATTGAHAATTIAAGSPQLSTQAALDFAAGDFNGDGVTDIASINGSTLSIMLKDANNNTIGARSYRLPGEGATIITVDANNDAKADLAVSLSAPPGGVAVLLGNGDGTFQQANTYGTNSVDALSVTTADFNGDGNFDLAIANNFCYTANTNAISVLLGNGDGTFRPPVNYPADACPVNLMTVDLNGDGQPDLVAVDGTSHNIFALLGRGDGTFNSPMSSPSGGEANSVTARDLNNDGIPDLALTTVNNLIAILLGKGDGTFQPPVQYAAGADTESLALVPSDGNSFAAMTFDRAGNGIVLTPGTPQGTLMAPVVQFVPGASQPTLTDVTGDGKPDILLVNSPDLLVMPGDGAGNFGAPVPVPFNAPQGYFFSGPIAVGDLNGDGIADVVVPYGATLSTSIDVGIGVMLGKTGGGFQPVSLTSLSNTALTSLKETPMNILLGDFNQDGKTDLAVLNSSGTSLLAGNGDGTFNSPVQTPVSGAKVAVAGDFNGDGNPDLLVAGTSGPVVLLGDGSGGFGAPVPVDVGDMNVSSAGVADFNGDHIPDIAVVDVNSGQAAILPGNGDGTFRTPVPVTIDTNPFQLSIVDWNGDGFPDLVMAHCCGALESVVYLNKGDGTFGGGMHLPSGPSARYVTAGDLTGGGKPGLVSVATVTGDVNLKGAVTVVPSVYPSAAANSPDLRRPGARSGATRK